MSAVMGRILLPDRGVNRFDPQRRPYPIMAPGARSGAWVHAPQEGEYRVYRLLENRQETVHVGADRLLALSFDNRLAEQFYFDRDTPEFRAKIEQIRQHRERLSVYFTSESQR